MCLSVKKMSDICFQESGLTACWYQFYALIRNIICFSVCVVQWWWCYFSSSGQLLPFCVGLACLSVRLIGVSKLCKLNKLLRVR